MSRRRSNTIESRMQIEQEQNEKIQNLSILEQQQKIKIILRRSNKRSRLIQISSFITQHQLLQFIQKQLYIPQDKQIIFWKGRKIILDPKVSSQVFQFHEKQVIHVHSKDIIDRQIISLLLFLLNTDLVKYRELQFSTNSTQIISNALKRSLMYQTEDITNFIYVQSGRYLNIQHSFNGEAIEDDSIIIAVPKEKGFPLSKLEEREIQILQSRMKLLKKPSLEFPIESSSLNFKKKLKYNVYRSMILPQTKQLVWKQDDTCDVSLKALPKKLTNKRITKISQKSQISQINEQKKQFQSVQQNKDNLFANCKNITQNSLKNSLHLSIDNNYKNSQKNIEQNKLSLSQNLNKSYNIVDLNLQPPKISNDSFQEVEQLDFGQNSTSKNCNDLKNSLKLNFKESMNKCIGALVAIPTLDAKLACHDN